MPFFSRKKDKDKVPSTPSSETASSYKNGRSNSGRTTTGGRVGTAKLPAGRGKMENGHGSVAAPAAPSLPKIPIPGPPDPDVDPVGYLKSIHSVRERSRPVLELAKRDQLRHFNVDMSKFPDAASYVCSIIKRDFAPDYSLIPPHGRWQHFEAGNQKRLDQLMARWPANIQGKERCRRLLDLFLVSVLLDAGAGTRWSYSSPGSPGKVFRRSEGLAIASLDMFDAGYFSSVQGDPHRVDAQGLKSLTVEMVGKGMQISQQNPLEGLEGRTGLLQRLGEALENEQIFGADRRAGNMLDYLLAHPTTSASAPIQVPLPTLWDTLMNALIPIWPPSRTKVAGVAIGDAWPLSTLISPTATSTPTSPPASDTSSTRDQLRSSVLTPEMLAAEAGIPEWKTIVPFHKLTQWLTYSLIPPMSKLMDMHFPGIELMTGLPEYRNGGLFIDMGVLTLKEEDMARGLRNYDADHKLRGLERCEVVPVFEAGDDVVVEWRAITVGLLDELLKEVNRGLGLGGLGQRPALNLAQMLEAGSWKGGREIAEIQRPNTKEPPIMIISDGTVF